VEGDVSHQPKSKDWLLSLYKRAPLGLFRADENWVLREANPQLAVILGYDSPSEIIGKSLLKHFVVDVEKLQQLPEILKERGSVDAYRVRARRKDGVVVWLSLYCTIVQEEGETWFDGLAIDFTKRKLLGDELRREKKNYQRLITNLPGIVYTATLEGKPSLVFVSPQTRSLLGISPDEIVAKGGFFDGLVHPKDREALELWLMALKSDVTPAYPHTVEIRMVDAYNNVRWFRNIAVMDEDEGTTLLHGMMFETTELRKAEEELRHAQKMEALGKLVAGIAHDFRNVLTAIMGFADMGMEETPKDSSAHHFFSVIMEQSEKASSLIKKLLDFARREEPHMEPIHPAAMLKNVAEVLFRTLPKQIEVVLELEEDLPYVKCDEVQMEQVLLNLAINARDAMPDGGRLLISASHCEIPPSASSPIPPGSYLRIVVEDTGTGMPPEVLERATEPFFTTKKRGVGTGLGLSQVVGIVKSHGGYFFLESEEGKGTRAIIYLPSFKDPFELPEEGEEPEGEVADSEQEGEGYRGSVLVVDDEKEIRSLISLMLENEGLRVYQASHGEEALELYRRLNGQIDLLITDMVMPRMGGKELISCVRELDPDLPVIAISGYASPFPENGLKEMDKVILLSKPITKKTLVETVNRLVPREEGHEK